MQRMKRAKMPLPSSSSTTSTSSSSCPKSCSLPALQDLLTVVIQTSPIPSHPSTALLDALFRSFHNYGQGVMKSRVIILADGVDVVVDVAASGPKNDKQRKDKKPATKDTAISTANDSTTTTTTTTTTKTMENVKHGKVFQSTAARYRTFLKELQRKIKECEFPYQSQEQGRIELMQLPNRHGSARAIRAVFYNLTNATVTTNATLTTTTTTTTTTSTTSTTPQVITTPYVMIGQHDNFLVRYAPIEDIVYAMFQHPGLGCNAKCIHFLSTSTINYLDKIQRRYQITMKQVETKPPLLLSTQSRKQKDDDVQPSISLQQQQLQQEYELIPLIFWYGRTHISTADYFRKYILETKCPTLKPKDHLEELLGPLQLKDIIQRGPSAHYEYGTYVLQPKNQSQEVQPQEVVYHLSGRRARAAAPELSNPLISYRHNSQNDGDDAIRNGNESSFLWNPNKVHGKSYTTARCCKAIVPGLTMVTNEVDDDTDHDNNDTDGNNNDNNKIPTTARTTNHHHKRPKPKGRFKQKCFHCGEKGHSFKFCPQLEGRITTTTTDTNSTTKEEPTIGITDNSLTSTTTSSSLSIDHEPSMGTPATTSTMANSTAIPTVMIDLS